MGYILHDMTDIFFSQ